MRVKPPFSMEAIRKVHTRVVAARKGWLRRRRTSGKAFPFRLPRSVVKTPTGWGWVEFLLLALSLAICAGIVWALG
jgi:hypothetical protein